jgi:hypothetical protein
MGLGVIGTDNIIHKRAFRWTLVISTCAGQVPKHFVKIANRPSIEIEETEINFLNGKTWIPGKGTWQSITVTYYDIAGSQNNALWSWLATLYDFTNPFTLQQATQRGNYKGTATLVLYDGCGVPLEQWILDDAWPQNVNFGSQELDYSSSEVATIELTLRYGQVQYMNLCGGQISPCGCIGCSE